ncbi:hypothetical protein BO82DRAFT_50793 [Aspergillus uvarum CBS 121591]|uniref:Uncharacterized protein n=1 Tax=Aspergillus uvarum CBS 121591 TaxID=1448315 RepID=A0A319CQ18_9EURO|nr:hypothetical protein BO82DRAFT_50793 [Aspergillus uvarum CBS 121591]PYH86680.1 hypothetical protein BO82DRAFT_50793 [Aspergillus uvarum CBS 121591]
MYLNSGNAKATYLQPVVLCMYLSPPSFQAVEDHKQWSTSSSCHPSRPDRGSLPSTNRRNPLSVVVPFHHIVPPLMPDTFPLTQNLVPAGKFYSAELSEGLSTQSDLSISVAEPKVYVYRYVSSHAVSPKPGFRFLAKVPGALHAVVWSLLRPKGLARRFVKL